MALVQPFSGRFIRKGGWQKKLGLCQFLPATVIADNPATEASHGTLAQLSAQVDLQASVLAFKNSFWVMGAVVLLLTPLPFIMRRPSAEETAAAAEAH